MLLSTDRVSVMWVRKFCTNSVYLQFCSCSRFLVQYKVT